MADHHTTKRYVLRFASANDPALVPAVMTDEDLGRTVHVDSINWRRYEMDLDVTYRKGGTPPEQWPWPAGCNLVPVTVVP